MNHPNERYHLDDDIISAYGNICSYGSRNQVSRHYLFLETIMVDGCPTLSCMEDGNFVYVSEKCSSFFVVQKVQEGILHYRRDMQKMKELFPGWRDERKFADRLFGRLFDGSCQVGQVMKQEFFNDDVFDGIKAYSVWSE